MLHMGMSLVLLVVACVMMTVGYHSGGITKGHDEAHSARQVDWLRQTVHKFAEKQCKDSFFFHWGRLSCRPKSTLLYNGFIGGSYYNDTSAAVESLCLNESFVPKISQRSNLGKGHQAYGAAFDVSMPQVAACAVCCAKRRSPIMIPGKKNCPKGWKKDYEGILMVAYAGISSPTENICVDQNMEIVGGKTFANLIQDGRLYKTNFKAGVLPSPELVQDNHPVFCVVCFK